MQTVEFVTRNIVVKADKAKTYKRMPQKITVSSKKKNGNLSKIEMGEAFRFKTPSITQYIPFVSLRIPMEPTNLNRRCGHGKRRNPLGVVNSFVNSFSPTGLASFEGSPRQRDKVRVGRVGRTRVYS